MSTLSEWLRLAGLESYERAFSESGVNLDVVPDLSETDLKELGLSLGDRKRFLKAAATLRPTALPEGQIRKRGPDERSDIRALIPASRSLSSDTHSRDPLAHAGYC